MQNLIRFMALVVFIAFDVFPAEITSFFDPGNKCDYLVVTPEQFSEGALKLVLYRNSNIYDDINHAGYVPVHKLLQGNPSIAPDTLIRNALRWASANWSVPPSYVVFLGDDSVYFNSTDSIFEHKGPMPTHFEGHIVNNPDTSYIQIDYNDTWYASGYLVQDGDTTDSYNAHIFSFGRIPCEDTIQLNRYIDKVIVYESMKPSAANNRIVFFADDSMQNDRLDPLFHEQPVYTFSESLHNRFFHFIWFSDFTGENRLRNARAAFFNTVDTGADWVVLSAHGHPGFLTDEKVLRAGDYTEFKNTNHPVVIFSMSCANGAFYKNKDSSMCKQYLFAPGGAAAYVANPNIAYFSSNTSLMQNICHQKERNPRHSIGQLLSAAQLLTSTANAGKYEIFGDPALKQNSVKLIQINAQLQQNGIITCTIDDPSFVSGRCAWQINRKTHTFFNSTAIYGAVTIIRDSIMYSDSVQVQDRIFDVSIPAWLSTDSAYLTLYVWNEDMEGRAGCSIDGASRASNFIAVKGKSAGFRVTVKRHLVAVIDFGITLVYPSVIDFYALDGSKAYTVKAPSGCSSLKVDLDEGKLRSGAYVAVLRDKTGIAGKEMVHLQ